MNTKKIVYGKNSIGCYATLYQKFMWIFWPDTYCGSTGDLSRITRDIEEWKEQYSIPDNLVIRKDI